MTYQDVNDFDKCVMEITIAAVGLEKWKSQPNEEQRRMYKDVARMLDIARSSWVGDFERIVVHALRERDAMAATLTAAQESGSKAVFRLQGQIIARDRARECLERALPPSGDVVQATVEAIREAYTVLLAAGVE